MTDGRLNLGIVGVLLLLLASPPHAKAEVAVALAGSGEQARPASLYELMIIVDDPNPTGAWARYNSDSNNRRVLNDQGVANGDGRPSLVFNTVSKLPTVVWAKNSPSDYDVVLSYFVNGTWTTPLVLAGSAANELDPQLAVDPADGSVHLVYWRDDSIPVVSHRQAPADLSSWTPAIDLPLPGDRPLRPSATIHNGNLVVVYENHYLGVGSTPREIVLATEQGGSFSTEVLALTHHGEENWPQIHSDGSRLWVEWIDADDQMAWTRQVTPGPWEPIVTQPYATVEEREYQVRQTIESLATN